MRPLSRRRRRSSSVGDEVAPDRAAEAAGREQDHAVLDRLDEQVVEADLAELVDDHDRVGERRIAQEPVEQRRLAGAEEAGEHGQRDRRAAARAGARSWWRSTVSRRRIFAAGDSAQTHWRRSPRAPGRRRESARRASRSPRMTRRAQRRHDGLGAEGDAGDDRRGPRRAPGTGARSRAHSSRSSRRPRAARAQKRRAASSAPASSADRRRSPAAPGRGSRSALATTPVRRSASRRRTAPPSQRSRRAASARPRQSRPSKAGPTTSATPTSASATTPRSARGEARAVDERAREHDQHRIGVEDHRPRP